MPVTPSLCCPQTPHPGPVQATLLGSLISGRWFLPEVLDAEEGLALLSERFQEEAGVPLSCEPSSFSPFLPKVPPALATMPGPSGLQ